jgi:Zn-finger protein
MSNFNELKDENAAQNLQVWYCENCRAVHFKADNILLNFTRTEFAELTNTVNEIYQQEFNSSEFSQLINLLDGQNDEVLLSQTIA